ncbi:MAG: hypothetical protein ACRELZ_02715 [Candidatus Rokuibacteriota bacterium]
MTDAATILRAGRARKYLVLLIALIVMLVVQPLLGHRSVAAGAFFDGLLAMIAFFAFFIVFEKRWQRRVALALVLPALASNVALYVLPAPATWASAVGYHCFLIVFLAFVVAVILRGIFSKRVIQGDDVLGAFAGYMLAAIAWGNLFALTYLLAPETFSVKPELAWRLGEWHRRRALFDYLSFTTLTSLGYSDLAPAGPPVYSLTWLEVIFGQFYIAVVVAQFVGLRLARAIQRDGPESK